MANAAADSGSDRKAKVRVHNQSVHQETAETRTLERASLCSMLAMDADIKK
jgi:hypothetical protein